VMDSKIYFGFFENCYIKSLEGLTDAQLSDLLQYVC